MIRILKKMLKLGILDDYQIVNFLDDYPFDLLHPGFSDFFSKSAFVPRDLLP